MQVLALTASAMDVRTADALRAEIAATRQRQSEADSRGQELVTEIRHAQKRRRLREELAEATRELEGREMRNQSRVKLIAEIDEDFCIASSCALAICRPKRPWQRHPRGGELTSCGHAVSRGEYVWKLQHLSWLSSRLWQGGQAFMSSEMFQVGSYRFRFRYNPEGGLLNPASWPTQHGTLAIFLHDDVECLLLRYSIFVKAAGGDFVQWGRAWDELTLRDVCLVFGPDVHWEGHACAERGIFGLTHAQLLQSEWVENDTLTIKFVLEVHPHEEIAAQPFQEALEIPVPSMKTTQRPCCRQALAATSSSGVEMK